MAIVKGSESRPLLKNAVVLDLGDLQKQAEYMIEQARCKAEAIIERGRKEAERLIAGASEKGWKKGHARGLEEGREEGREKGRKEAFLQYESCIKEMDVSWNHAIEQWERDRGNLLLAAREEVLAFAFAMGEKVVHRTIQHDPAVIQDQLAEALSLLLEPTAATVQIHPQDRGQVEEVLPEILSMLDQCKHIELCDDAFISPGGCTVRARGGSIDARIETQLDRLAETLLPSGRLGSEANHVVEESQDEQS